MSEMWDSVAPGWEANATFVDAQLALATDALLDAAGVGEGDAVLDVAAGPGAQVLPPRSVWGRPVAWSYPTLPPRWWR